jgi:sortase A
MLKKYVLAIVILTLTMTAFFQLGSGAKIASKAWLSQYLIAQAWSRTLLGEERVRPWLWADTWPVAELSVPSLDIQQVVLSGDSGSALAFGPGMREYVDAGLGLDLTILSGHRDTHFSFLKDIGLNDIFLLKGADGLQRQYQVIEMKVVDENWSLPSVNDDVKSVVILATCYPFDLLVAGTDKRLLIFAVPSYSLANQESSLTAKVVISSR